MIKKDKDEVMKKIIWFNLFIGIYNLYVFNEFSSIFHLLLGAMNIGVWVFFRQKYLDFSIIKFIRLISKKQPSSNN